MAKKRKKSKKEFSKVWVAIILIVSLLDLNLLIVLDRMETLAVAIVTEVIAVALGYMVKAYLGKKQEEENKMVYDLAKDIEEDNEV